MTSREIIEAIETTMIAGAAPDCELEHELNRVYRSPGIAGLDRQELFDFMVEAMIG